MARGVLGWRVAAWAALAVAAPTGTVAQQASIGARANVSIIALSIAGARDLDFGTVTAGTPVNVDPRVSLTAGKFQINGIPFAQFQMTFTLPTSLQRAAGPQTMPIGFGPSAACGRNTDVQATCVYFDPANPMLARIRLSFPPNNNYFVWVGGTVTPALSQAPGLYQGAVTATVAYTGN